MVGNGDDKEENNVIQFHKANVEFDYYTMYCLYHGAIESLYIC